jgi:hypothetical protein
MTFKGGGMLLLGAIIISIAHRPHSCRYYYSFYFFFDFLKTFCDHQSFFGWARPHTGPPTHGPSFSIQTALKVRVPREMKGKLRRFLFFIIFTNGEKKADEWLNKKCVKQKQM